MEEGLLQVHDLGSSGPLDAAVFPGRVAVDKVAAVCSEVLGLGLRSGLSDQAWW